MHGFWAVSIKQNINVKIKPPSTFVFLDFQKHDMVKRSSSIEYVWAYYISWSHVERRMSCIHLRRLNVRHFRMVKGARLKKYVVEVTLSGMTP